MLFRPFRPHATFGTFTSGDALRLLVAIICRGFCAKNGLANQIMNEATKRSIFRWIHIVFAIPIIGYIYSPFKELPNYAPVVRFIAIPVIIFTGLWMWKGHVVRRLWKRSPAGKK
jgi:hypothetical protein